MLSASEAPKSVCINLGQVADQTLAFHVRLAGEDEDLERTPSGWFRRGVLGRLLGESGGDGNSECECLRNDSQAGAFCHAYSHIVWFEIPADDVERAKKFYGALLGWKIERFQGPTAGSAAATGMVCTPSPGMLKTIVSEPGGASASPKASAASAFALAAAVLRTVSPPRRRSSLFYGPQPITARILVAAAIR